ncbi:hypothetical protein J18TS1_27830 [Oceanobacillus oncorhynchi subsp. incaldanensis]|uniref:amidohydrolase n=1 Tax=Oceanobacillus oncorhynchi TaxID=545501 RepID=UPI001B1C32E5|nr:amidohydrolase [Oceanobacillus oncorhynchi]GIO19683.1 hypothetical protein J18TS1_27830 [Oceanobacillus oncorhynchi subsp. incaldanensis]
MVKADIVLSGNHVFTGLHERTEKASIAIINNKIAAVGTQEEIQPMIGEQTVIHQFEDELIVPGFHDFHVHFMMGSLVRNDTVHLHDSESAEEGAKMVAAYAESRPNDEWIIGLGWDHTNWQHKELPHRKVLDRYISDRPVILFNAELHYAWVNSKAIEVCGLTKDTPNPDYGQVGKDAIGELTGLLFEHAIGYVTEFAYRFSKEKRASLIKDLLTEAAKYGVTSVNDLFAANTAPKQVEDLEVYSHFEEQGTLTTRIHFSPELKMDVDDANRLKEKYRSDKLAFSGLKQFIDGVVTGHTAYLLDVYKDQPETTGDVTKQPGEIKQLVKQADKHGFQIRFHAIGNGAIRLALDAFEEAIRENGKRDARHIIEHVEVLHPDDVQRFQKLGVIASFQPSHVALMPKEAYTSRISEKQKPLYFPVKTIMDTEAAIAFGTDFPVAPLNPLLGIYHALTRTDLNGQSWEGAEKISLAQAIRAYTITPAYGSFRENELGTIEEGKLADISVLNENLFEISIDKIPETEAIMTVMDGRIVYESKKKIIK